MIKKIQLILMFAITLMASVVSANAIHPDINLLDAQSNPTNLGNEFNAALSCGACHDSHFITSSLSDVHQHIDSDQNRFVRRIDPNLAVLTGESETDCLQCHSGLEPSAINDIVAANGVISATDLLLTAPTSNSCGNCHSQVALNPDQPFEFNLAEFEQNQGGWTGELYVGQRISESAVNIQNKADKNFSFDIHAERVLRCADCHAAPNNPAGMQLNKDNNEEHLRFDPRVLQSHDYLNKPDHGFEQARQCDQCHDPDAGHDWLVYPDRHFAKLACTSCHISQINAPSYSVITQQDTSGDLEREAEWRSKWKVEWKGIDNDGLITGYSPWLLPDANGKLSPFNLVTLNLKTGSEVKAYPINHGVSTGAAIQDCNLCHDKNSLLTRALPGTPVNMELPGNYLNDLNEPQLAEADIYVIGSNQVPWIDWIGLTVLMGTIFMTGGHGLARYLAWRKREHQSLPRKKVYMYGKYERLWHWLQALIVLILIVTGGMIHKPWLFGWVSFPFMVQIHNILGFVLLVNAVLALFYHLASGEIKQYIPMPDDLFVKSLEQIRFYASGIFYGAPHPYAKTREQKLNPLQKTAYFGLLNVLLPGQMLTGLLIWGLQRWPEQAAFFGGLTWLGPIHSLLAWFFATFLIMHIYLTTTSGPKPLSAIKAMVEGWEHVESDESSMEPK